MKKEMIVLVCLALFPAGRAPPPSEFEQPVVEQPPACGWWWASSFLRK